MGALMSVTVNTVVDYIFSMETANTVIGQKLKQAAITKAEPSVVKEKQKEDEYQLVIRDICQYDADGCMCWVDYRSWMTMPKKLQKSIEELLFPKAWRGMVFQYDQWTLHERMILTNLHQDIILILAKDNNKYRIHTIPLYKSYLDWMSPNRFRELTQKITKTAIKTYGRSCNKIFILDNDDNNVEEFIIT
jgi:hypothetical protein